MRGGVRQACEDRTDFQLRNSAFVIDLVATEQGWNGTEEMEQDSGEAEGANCALIQTTSLRGGQRGLIYRIQGRCKELDLDILCGKPQQQTRRCRTNLLLPTTVCYTEQRKRNNESWKPNLDDWKSNLDFGFSIDDAFVDSLLMDDGERGVARIRRS